MFPPRVVLAAVDFSEPSRIALTCAVRLSRHCGAALHVLHAEDPLLAGAASVDGVDLAQETRDELEAFVEVANPADRQTPTYHVVSGAAVDVICDIAVREGADIIVVGMHGMSGVERTMFGSTTEGVLRRADTSVLVVPESWTPPRPDAPDLTGMGPVVAAIDRSAPALAAARAGSRLASLLGTTVDAVHVVPPLSVPARWLAHADAALRERVAAAQQELTAALTNIDSEHRPRLLVQTGGIAEQLTAAVAPMPGTHPILVLGRRTHAERGGAPGRTAYRVLTLAAVPVLMYLPQD
jgi:nucleotide-binding universal stress UspA family protein